MEMILTIVVLSFWIVFPIAMFLSVGHIDKLRESVEVKQVAKKTPRKIPRVSQRPTLIPH